jgi:predicted nucleotidyltransferase
VRQIDRVLRLVQDALGANAIGVYLHGSGVLGGLRPTSDLDVLVVCARPLTEAERRALVTGLLRVSLPTAHPDRGDTRSVELTVVVQAAVRPWRYPPVCELQYGDWLRPEYERGAIPPPEPSPDVAVLITNALAGNAPLFGPPPADVLDPVPPADLRRAMVAGVAHLLEDLEWDTRNVLLTLARIWVTLDTGEIVPKDVAAAWAIARLPQEHRPVLARARAIYLDEVTGWDDALRGRALPLAEYLVREIERREPF